MIRANPGPDPSLASARRRPRYVRTSSDLARGVLLGASLGLAVVAVATAQTSSGDAPPPDPERELRQQMVAYRDALDRTARFSTTQGELGVHLYFYADAREYEIVQRLAHDLEREKPLKLALRSVEKDAKKLDDLKDKVGVRLELVHPGLAPKKKDKAKTETRTVHLFAAALDQSAPLTIGGAKIPWRAWRELDGLETAKVQLARHFKFVRHRQVPIVGPLEPN
ncbi:MAG: hypothetical protein KDC38_20105, partial [Planctomycetes bacterium]|nr:hypothetical protein [Planctomycetota bacterium]